MHGCFTSEGTGASPQRGHGVFHLGDMEASVLRGHRVLHWGDMYGYFTSEGAWRLHLQGDIGCFIGCFTEVARGLHLQGDMGCFTEVTCMNASPLRGHGGFTEEIWSLHLRGNMVHFQWRHKLLYPQATTVPLRWVSSNPPARVHAPCPLEALPKLLKETITAFTKGDQKNSFNYVKRLGILEWGKRWSEIHLHWKKKKKRTTTKPPDLDVGL